MLTVLITVLIFSLILGMPAFASGDDAADLMADLRSLLAEAKKGGKGPELSKYSKKDVETAEQFLGVVKNVVTQENQASNAVKMRRDEEKLIRDLIDQRHISTEDELRKSEASLKIAQLNYRVMKNTAKVWQESVNHGEDLLAKAKFNVEAAEERLKKLEEAGELDKKQIATEKNFISEQQKEVKNLTTALGVAEKQLKKARELEHVEKNRLHLAAKKVKAEKEIEGATAGFLHRYTSLSAKFEDTLLGSISTRIEAMGSIEDALGAVGNQLSKQLEPANVFGSLLDSIVASTKLMVLQADSAFASFDKTTGAVNEYDDIIMAARVDTASMGIAFSEVAEATQDLFLGMRHFTMASEEARTELVGFAATMENLGVSSSTTADFLNKATTSLNMNADQAMAAQRELAGAAIALGMAPSEMMEGFNAAQSQLAKWGEQSIEIFEGVAAASKATGIEMGELLSVVGQFDTFEGAAEAAGRLNAILGDDLLNSVDLLNASEDERIRMMIESMEQSGRSWDAMGRFERQAMANAVGITDMSTANQLFGQSLSAYDQQQREVQASSLSQEEMEERAAAAASAQEKLRAVVESLAIAVRPLIDVFMGLMNIILGIQKFTQGAFVPALAALVGIYGLFWARMKAGMMMEKVRMGYLMMTIGLEEGQAAAVLKHTAARGLFLKAQLRNLKAAGLTIAVFAVLMYAFENTAVAVIAAAAALGIYLLYTRMGNLEKKKEIILSLQSTGAMKLEVAQEKLATIAKRMQNTERLRSFFIRIKERAQRLLGIATTQAETVTTQIGTIAEQQNTGAKKVGIITSFRSAAARFAETVKKRLSGVATEVETVAETKNTTAKNLNIVATLKKVGAAALDLAKTIASVTWTAIWTTVQLGAAAAAWVVTTAYSALNVQKGISVARDKLSVLWGKRKWLMDKAQAVLMPILTALGFAKAASETTQAATGPAAASGTWAMTIAAIAAVVPVGALAIAIGLLAIGVGLIAIAIAAVVLGFIWLVSLFIESPAAAMLAALGIGMLGVALMVLAVGLAAVIIVAIPGVIALALLGLGALIASAGFSALGGAVQLLAVGLLVSVPMLSLFAENISGIDASMMFILAAGLIALATAFAYIGLVFMLPWTSVGLLAVSAGLLAIGTAFKFMSVEKMAAFENFTNQMKDMDKDVGVNMKIVGSGIGAMTWPLLFFPAENAVALGEMVGSMAELSTASSPAAVESAKQMTEVIKEAASIKIGVASMLLWDKAVNNLIKVLQGGEGGGEGAAAGAGAGTTVVLELDRRQLGRTVVELVNERYNLNASSA